MPEARVTTVSRALQPQPFGWVGRNIYAARTADLRERVHTDTRPGHRRYVRRAAMAIEVRSRPRVC
jgi:hypothetical protein